VGAERSKPGGVRLNRYRPKKGQRESHEQDLGPLPRHGLDILWLHCVRSVAYLDFHAPIAQVVATQRTVPGVKVLVLLRGGTLVSYCSVVRKVTKITMRQMSHTQPVCPYGIWNVRSRGCSCEMTCDSDY
jgi:hypothetical protein